jgi:hypothetical protein
VAGDGGTAEMAEVGDRDEIFELAECRHQAVIGRGRRMLQPGQLGGFEGPRTAYSLCKSRRSVDS